jgi:hypothetical protein
MHSTLTGGAGGGGEAKSDIVRVGGLRCFCGVEAVDLVLEIDGAFVDSEMEGGLTFASGVCMDGAFPFISVVLRRRTADALVVLGRNNASSNPG